MRLAFLALWSIYRRDYLLWLALCERYRSILSSQGSSKLCKKLVLGCTFIVYLTLKVFNLVSNDPNLLLLVVELIDLL